MKEMKYEKGGKIDNEEIMIENRRQETKRQKQLIENR